MDAYTIKGEVPYRLNVASGSIALSSVADMALHAYALDQNLKCQKSYH